jgi:ABC-type thiamin/hydroxymethylpyrimidine transport system permease subunit
MPTERQADLRRKVRQATWDLAQSAFALIGSLAFGIWAIVEIITHQALTDRGIALFALAIAWRAPTRFPGGRDEG